ncbi:MAG TPA: hypothetical protein DD761_21015 [Cyanobacteria bacterium UBA11691]|nr:hypothetical protein [Cyanobacteria bacterium UBA11691]
MTARSAVSVPARIICTFKKSFNFGKITVIFAYFTIAYLLIVAFLPFAGKRLLVLPKLWIASLNMC